MGKPTGFLEYQRQLPKDRPPKERMKDWDEFHTHFDLAQLQLQGARCMDCGVPFWGQLQSMCMFLTGIESYLVRSNSERNLSACADRN